VTLDGSPMSDGDVYFVDSTTGASSVLTVTNGNFDGKSEAGTFKVEINQFRDESVQADPTGYVPPGGTTKKNVILPEYNVDSKITAEVTSSGPNDFKFEAKTPVRIRATNRLRLPAASACRCRENCDKR
jgi:hypothetical protein